VKFRGKSNKEECKKTKRQSGEKQIALKNSERRNREGTNTNNKCGKEGILGKNLTVAKRRKRKEKILWNRTIRWVLKDSLRGGGYLWGGRKGVLARSKRPQWSWLGGQNHHEIQKNPAGKMFAPGSKVYRKFIVSNGCHQSFLEKRNKKWSGSEWGGGVRGLNFKNTQGTQENRKVERTLTLTRGCEGGHNRPTKKWDERNRHSLSKTEKRGGKRNVPRGGGHGASKRDGVGYLALTTVEPATTACKTVLHNSSPKEQGWGDKAPVREGLGLVNNEFFQKKPSEGTQVEHSFSDETWGRGGETTERKEKSFKESLQTGETTGKTGTVISEKRGQWTRKKECKEKRKQKANKGTRGRQTPKTWTPNKKIIPAPSEFTNEGRLENRTINHRGEL